MANPKIPIANKENMVLAEQFFGQVSESIQLVFDLTSRIDERVKMLIQDQKEIDERMERLMELHNQSTTRLALAESNPLVREDIAELNHKIALLQTLKKDLEEVLAKVHTMELKQEGLTLRIGNHDNRWSQIFDAIWKVALMLVAGYILYKLGLQAPPG